MLKYLAAIYNPLGIALPVNLSENVIFKGACDLKVSWHNIRLERLDQELTSNAASPIYHNIALG